MTSRKDAHRAALGLGLGLAEPPPPRELTSVNPRAMRPESGVFTRSDGAVESLDGVRT